MAGKNNKGGNMGVQEKLVREVNRHNRDFISEIAQKMGSDWKLVYSNKRVRRISGYARKHEIAVGHIRYFYNPLNFPLMLLEEHPKLDRESFKRNIDYLCKMMKGQIYADFMEQYGKIYEIESLAENLAASLQKNDEPRILKRKCKI